MQDLIKYYKKRIKSKKTKELYHYYKIDNHVHKLWRTYYFTNFINKNFKKNLSKIKFLDFGCGNGNFFLELLSWGALPNNCTGVDLINTNIKNAKQKLPKEIELIVGTETKLSNKKKFDVIFLNTVLSSIPDEVCRLNLLKSLTKKLNKNGIILIFDFIINNPKNSFTRKLNYKKIIKTFYEFEIKKSKIILAPLISRIFYKFGLSVGVIFEFMPLSKFLYSHICISMKKEDN
jgi:2-polyprenyl-3-methyl-5-hydroxy-6-metoxy-1,4-benzoquinol methylase